MKKVFILGILSLIFLSGQSQVIVTGKLVDSISNQPISYATLGIVGSNKSTISNEQGVFKVKVDSLPFSITIFCIGYTHKITLVNSTNDLAIRLNPLSYHLPEITVKANEGEILFGKAYQKLKNQKPFFYKAKSFFRLLTKNDDRYTEMIENFYDTWLGKSGIKYWELEHGRYAVVKDRAEKGYVLSIDFSILTRYLDILNKHESDIKYPLFPFDKDAKKVVTFSVTNKYKSNNQEIVKVDFEVKPNSICTRCYKGSIYIDANNYSIYRLIMECKNVSVPPVFIYSKRDAINNFNIDFDITFHANQKQQMLINHVRLNIDYDKTTNNAPQLNHHVYTYSDLIFYDYSNSPQNINKIPDEDYINDYDAVEEKIYFKRFWDNNPILEQTSIEKSVTKNFEKSGSFGKAFNQINDTFELLRDGYFLWNEQKELTFKNIPNKHATDIRPDKMEINLNGLPEGGIYSKLFFAKGCFNDSFYYITLPLLDVKATWASDSIRQMLEAEYIYQKYFDLLEVNKRKLKYELSKVTLPCSNLKSVNQIYNQILIEFHNESLQFLNEAWGIGKNYKWGLKIENDLENYKDYK